MLMPEASGQLINTFAKERTWAKPKQPLLRHPKWLRGFSVQPH